MKKHPCIGCPGMTNALKCVNVKDSQCKAIKEINDQNEKR